MTAFQVVFQPSGRRGQVPAGQTVLAAAQQLGAGIEASCGGAGVCGKCKVIIEGGNPAWRGGDAGLAMVSPVNAAERHALSEAEIVRGYRLACQVQVAGNVLVTVPEESRSGQQVILNQGAQRETELRPAVKNYTLQLEAATLVDARDDLQRLMDGLTEKYGLRGLAVDYAVLRRLPYILREADWQVTVTVRQETNEIIRVRPGKCAENLGVAIDIGTTTLAAYLCELNSGVVWQTASRMDSQIRYGEDILARISYAMTEPDGQEKLQAAILEDINALVHELAEKAKRQPEDIDELVLVYNTAMHHFTLGIDPSFVGRAPFAPAVRRSLDIKARDLRIHINPAGYIHSLPIEAGFVGADNVAVLLAEAPYKGDEVKLIIDIGTNGEIDLGNRDRLLSTSCATGPALEGAQIKFGMRAAPGAIEHVQIDAATGKPRYKLIGSETWYPEDSSGRAKGICGSGILDGIAALLQAGLLSRSGRLDADAPTSRMRKDAAGKLEYVLAWARETAIGQDIVIHQSDIRAVQLAKAAIFVGAQYLMEKYGVTQVDEVILAGAFGSYINKASAMALGMFPACDLSKVKAVGNAAGDGAKMALLSVGKRREAERVARQVEFVETAIEPDFQQKFMAALAFPAVNKG